MEAVMSIFFKSPQLALSQVEFETAILEKLKHIARITTIFSQAPRQNEHGNRARN